MKPASTTFDFNLFFVKAGKPTDIAWYKWEFLRRNSEFRADYSCFTEEFGAWLKAKGFWYDTDRRRHWTVGDQRKFRTRILPSIVELCQRWRVDNLFPPRWQFSKATGLRKLGKRSIFLPTGTPYD